MTGMLGMRQVLSLCAGPIDDYFSQKGWERLEYRSIVFEKEYARCSARGNAGLHLDVGVGGEAQGVHQFSLGFLHLFLHEA